MEPKSHNLSPEEKQLVAQLKKNGYPIRENNLYSRIKWDDETDTNCNGTIDFVNLTLTEPVIPQTIFYERYMDYYELFRIKNEEYANIPMYFQLDVNILIHFNEVKFVLISVLHDVIKNKFENNYYGLSEFESKRVLRDTNIIVPVFSDDFIKVYNTINKTAKSVYSALRKGVFKGKPYELTDLVEVDKIEIRMKYNNAVKTNEDGRPVIQPDIYSEVYARPPRGWTEEEINSLEEKLKERFLDFKIKFFMLGF